MTISILTNKFNREICKIPWAIFSEVAVTIVGNVKAENAGWNPFFKMCGKRLKTKKKNIWDEMIIMMIEYVNNWCPPTRTNEASSNENGAQ